MSDLMEEYVRNRFAAEVTAMQNAFDQKTEQQALLIAQQTERAEQAELKADQAERKLAVCMLRFGKSVEEVAAVTELPIEKVQGIATQIGADRHKLFKSGRAKRIGLHIIQCGDLCIGSPIGI